MIALFVYFLKSSRNLIFSIIFVVVSLPLLLLSVWRFILNLIVPLLYPELSPLRATDNFVMCIDCSMGDPNSKLLNLNLCVSMKLEGNINGKTFFQQFESHVINIDYTNKDINQNHPHINFHRSIQNVCGYWFFKTFPNKLKYRDHVTCVTLPTNKSCEEEICEWLKIRYDITKCPLWGILLIYREGKKDTVFVLKMHHVLADGYSLLHILDLLTNTRYKYLVKDFQDSVLDKYKMLTESAYNMFEQDLQRQLTPTSAFYQMEDEEIFLVNVSIPLQTIKDIRVKAQVRFQSVMIHLIFNYLHDLMLNTVKEKGNVPNKIILANSLPWPRHPRFELCNHATLGFFTFNTTDHFISSKEKLILINNQFENLLKIKMDKAFYYVNPLILGIPTMCFGHLKNTWLSKLAGIYIHLIGSNNYEQVFGINCKDANMFLTPIDQKNVIITCLTTSNEVRMSIMGPKSIFSTQSQAEKFSRENIKRHTADLKNCE